MNSNSVTINMMWMTIVEDKQFIKLDIRHLRSNEGEKLNKIFVFSLFSASRQKFSLDSRSYLFYFF